jgi:hypothetical protein
MTDLEIPDPEISKMQKLVYQPNNSPLKSSIEKQVSAGPVKLISKNAAID